MASGDFDFKHRFASPRGVHGEIEFNYPKAAKDCWGSFRAIEEKKTFLSRIRTDKGHRWAGRHRRNVYGREMTIFCVQTPGTGLDIF